MTALREERPGFVFHRHHWWGLVGAGIWLVYLQSPLQALWHADGSARVVGLAALGVFCVVYLAGMLTVAEWAWHGPGRPTLLIWGYIAVLLLLALLTIPGAGDRSSTFAVFIGAAAMIALPVRPAIGVVLTLAAVVESSARLVAGWSDHGDGFAVLLAAAAVGFMRMALRRARALQDAQQELADAAVAEERSRIAQDLHDILGHSLTVITVKAELAQRLFDVDADRARAEIGELESLSRDALSDVRATALGVRGVSLAGELAAAREALDTADIDSEVPTTADEVPSRWRELFAWTIRETVTNVVRHSKASRCEVQMTPCRVVVADDGVGMPTPAPLTGQGLVGLRARVTEAGATLTTMTGLDGAGARVVVEVPHE